MNRQPVIHQGMHHYDEDLDRREDLGNGMFVYVIDKNIAKPQASSFRLSVRDANLNWRGGITKRLGWNVWLRRESGGFVDIRHLKSEAEAMRILRFLYKEFYP